MTFADTYREERLISRRSRARKARIAGRIIGFGLTACLVVALRTDPQLRAMVEDVALSVISSGGQQEDAVATAQADAIAGLGYAEGSQQAQALQQLGLGEAEAPRVSQLPQSRVKVHRGGISADE